MKKYLSIYLIIFTSFCFGQNRYLVSGSGNYIKIPDGQSATELIGAANAESEISNNPNRIPSAWLIRGFPIWDYPPDTSLLVHHKDVIGSWFVAPVKGAIDSVYWYAGDSNGAKDSLVFLRIHQSIVGPDWGPGIPPYPSPPVSWGYWLNSLDQDKGVAAFPDDATDTTWFSTIDEMGGTVPKSRPPFGYAIWGALGYGKIHRPGICAVRMLDAGEPCSVEVGEKFFVSLRVNSGPLHPTPSDNPTAFTASHVNVPAPPQAWIYYEHDSVFSPTAKRGWHAIPDVNMNIWYLIKTDQPYPGSVIMGHKYHDLNNDGLWDEGEPSIPNWPISLSGRYSTSTQTDINGFYQFSGLDSGTYIVSEGQRSGWIPTHPSTGEYQINLKLNDTTKNLNFGNFKLSSILIRKFHDLDGNINTSDDRVPQMWNLNLYKDSISTQTLISVVNSNSYLSVQDLQPGIYIATEADSTGWLSIGKVSNENLIVGPYSVDTLILTSGQSGYVDFINYRPRIVIKKSADSDGDFGTVNDRVKKSWSLFLYQDYISEANLYASVANTESLVVYSPPAGFYIAVESDSAGWIQLGKIVNKVPYPTSSEADSFIYNSTDVIVTEFINFKPNKIVVKKLYDIDGVTATSDDRFLKKWNFNLYKNNLSTLIASVSSSESLSVDNLGDGTYIVTEADSIGWYSIGKTIDGYFIPGQSKADTFQLIGGQIKRIDFINTTPGITVRKFRDIDGLLSTVYDRSLIKWNLTLYRNSVAPGNIITTASSAESLVIKGLTPGAYIAREADSVGWSHIGTILNGISAPSQEKEIQFTIMTTESYTADFINTSQSSIIIRKFADQDGDFRTTGDRTLKNWSLSLHKDTITSGIIVGFVSSSPILTVSNLEPGKYVAVEADSQSWAHISTIVDGISQGGTAVNYWTINLNTGESHIVDFVNFDLKRRKYWTATTNCEWNIGSNWEPPGIPIPGDTIIVSSLAQCTLTIPPDAMLGSISIAAGESVYVPSGSIMSIGGDAIIDGNLVIQEGDNPQIIVEGNWVMRGNFLPGNSTVVFSGLGYQIIDGSDFYNVQLGSDSMSNIIGKNAHRVNKPFGESANIITNGNWYVAGTLKMYENVDAKFDTIFILNNADTALTGSGIVTRGSVHRKILQGSLENYQFESKDSYLRFNGQGTYPYEITMTIYPDTTPDNFGNYCYPINSVVDTFQNIIIADSIDNLELGDFPTYAIGEKLSAWEFQKVNRVYIIKPNGGMDINARLSMRYNQIEVPPEINENNLQLLVMIWGDGVNDTLAQVPHEFSLQQNYPNPFNPETRIKYSIPKESFVSIKIFDILGREVVTLVNEKKQPGDYEISWNSSNTPSGVYYYRIMAGDFIQTKKMLLIR